VTGESLVTGRTQITLKADASLASVDARSYDLLFIPGGPGVKMLRTNARVEALIRDFVRLNKPIAAICAAPLLLADAGLLKGKKFTAHFSTQTELPQALASEKVVVDGLLITSRGAGTAQEFGLALVKYLFGEPAMKEVAKAIMA
jgi:4-methyl-5(b-hydroxyethyl)-thiazole monophosphate biosynthesis